MSSLEDQSHDDSSLEVSPEHLSSRQDELIVAIPYVDLVIDKMIGLPVRVIGRERSDDLGLELLKLEFGVHFLTDSATQRDLANAKAANPQPPGSVDPKDRVGPLMEIVKYKIAVSSGKWVPTMGRNRELGHLTATDGRVISFDDDPKAVEPDKYLPSLEELRTKAGEPRREVVVGIADTALWDHPWYASARIDKVGPFPVPSLARPGSANPYRTAHSTFVSGLILAQAPSARLIVSGVLDSEGIGDSWQVAKSIAELAKTKIDILNLSFCQFTGDAKAPLALATAIDRLDSETVVVAGAGNYGGKERKFVPYPGADPIDLSIAPEWPAALDDVVAVGSTKGATSERATFSPDAHWVDILAPGDTVVSTFIGALLPERPARPFARWSGTSFSTAIVTGAIAARMAAMNKSARAAWQDILLDASLVQFGLKMSATGLTTSSKVPKVLEETARLEKLIGEPTPRT
jgi:subtilisin family serine protease